MAQVVVYTSAFCPYCRRACELLKDKGIEFTELSVEGHSRRWYDMVARSRRETVPQIFIDGLHVGGFDDLKALDEAGKLGRLLGLS